MRLHIQLPAKAGWLRISNCEAEEVLSWPDEVFQEFLKNPQTQDRLSARSNYYDEEGSRVYCGILVLREGRSDGVFAYDYGRHFAYLPGARAVVDSILERAAEKIVQEGTENTHDGKWSYFFDELYEQMGLVAAQHNGVGAMLLDKLRKRPETAEVDISDESFEVRFHLNYCKVFQMGGEKALCALWPNPSEPQDGCPFWRYVLDECERQWNELQRDEYGPWNIQPEEWKQEYFSDMYTHILEARSDVIECGDVLPPDHPKELAWELAQASHQTHCLIAYLAAHDGSEDLYQMLHHELGMTNQEIGAMGFDLAHRYEPDANDAYQDIVDYIQFEQETTEIWPWSIADVEILANKDALRGIANRLAAAGAWDTESIYQELSKTFGIAPALSPDQGPELKL